MTENEMTSTQLRSERAGDKPLSGNATLGTWIDHPVGGPLMLAFLAEQGQEPATMEQARPYSLNQLVTVSRGALRQEQVDDLVRAANGGVLVVDDDEAAEPEPAPDRPVASGLTLADIQIRDPFLLQEPATGTYYLYGSTDPNVWFGRGTGFDTYRSSDLEHWEGPFPAFRPPAGFWSPGQYWAPEVHQYAGRWFMFATFTGSDDQRGTQVLAADHPEGPFTPWSDGPVTPTKWRCLDGTLFVDDSGDPWIVYCHEWTQVHDGGVVAQRLTQDLRQSTENPIYLFNASEAPWTRPMRGVPFDDYKLPVYISDGCFLFRLSTGHLIMLWSSFGDHGYAMGIAHSETGLVTGPWTQEEDPLWAADGGHGMIVRLGDQRLAITLHQPNTTPHERAVISYLAESERTVTLLDPAAGSQARAQV